MTQRLLIPAITANGWRYCPRGKPAQVEIEIADSGARMALPERPGTTVNWLELPASCAKPGEALVMRPMRDAELNPQQTQIWVAGEAAAMQRIRRQLFEARGILRALGLGARLLETWPEW